MALRRYVCDSSAFSSLPRRKFQAHGQINLLHALLDSLSAESSPPPPIAGEGNIKNTLSLNLVDSVVELKKNAEILKSRYRRAPEYHKDRFFNRSRGGSQEQDKGFRGAHTQWMGGGGGNSMTTPSLG